MWETIKIVVGLGAIFGALISTLLLIELGHKKVTCYSYGISATLCFITSIIHLFSLEFLGFFLSIVTSAATTFLSYRIHNDLKKKTEIYKPGTSGVGLG